MTIFCRVLRSLAVFLLIIFLVSPVLGADADSPEINIVLDYTSDTFFYYEWEYSLPDPSLIILEYSIGDDESWVPNTDYPFDVHNGKFLYGSYGNYYMLVYKELLEPETDYYFRARYSELTSNSVHVRVSPPELIELEQAFSTVDLTVLPVGSDLSGIELPRVVPCQYNGRFNVLCDVIWEDLAQADVSKPGWLYIKGDVIPPDGFCKSPDFAAYYPIMLFEQGMEPEPVEALTGTYLLIVVPVGTDPDTLPATRTVHSKPLPDTVEYLTSNGIMDEFSVTWDFSAVDTSKTGSYALDYTTDLPVCFTAPQFSARVGVVASDRIDLSGYCIDFLNKIFCHWIYEVEDFDNIRLEYSIDDGPWQDAQAQLSYGVMSTSGVIHSQFNGGSLIIHLINEVYNECFIRLVYNDEPTNILRITPQAGGYAVSLIVGDRGGADQEPQNPPGLEQPAPSPGGGDGGALGGQSSQPPRKELEKAPIRDENSTSGSQNGGQEADTDAQPPDSNGAGNDSGGDLPPSGGAATETDGGSDSEARDTASQTRPVQAAGTIPLAPSDDSNAAARGAGLNSAPGDLMMEYSTDDSISISGLRLREMLKLAGNTVLFEKQGMSVELPADFLHNLDVADNARFTVRIAKTGSSFTLEILLDGVSLSALPPTAVFVPYSLADSADAENLACFDAQGREISAASYDASLQIVRVEIQATGSYTVAERAAITLPLFAREYDGSADSEFADEAVGSPAGWLILPAAGIVAAALSVGATRPRRRSGMRIDG